MELSLIEQHRILRDRLNVFRQMAHFAWQKSDLLFSQVQNGKFQDKRKSEILGESLYFTNVAISYEIEVDEINEELSKYTASQ